MIRHPADEARRQSLLVMVGLVLLLPRVLKVYRSAGAARQLERELREKHARELNDLDEQQMSRVADLGNEVRALREQLGQQPPAAPAT